jgi:hypothetical protein
MWVLVLPSMPKGEIVGKYLIDNEWKIFNRQRMLVIDGKYNNEDGMSNRQENRRKVQEDQQRNNCLNATILSCQIED